MVVWFNPPFNKGVKTNVAATFLQIIEACFPPDHPLRPILNRNTIKVSYRTMTNMTQVISKNNHKVIRDSKPAPIPTPSDLCNCKAPYLPPLPLGQQVLDRRCCLQRQGHCHHAAAKANHGQPSPSAHHQRGVLHGHHHQHRQKTDYWAQRQHKQQGAEGDHPQRPHLGVEGQGLCLLECWYILFRVEQATL